MRATQRYQTLELATCALASALMLLVGTPPAFGDGSHDGGGSVTLPLDDYLNLVDRIESVDQGRNLPPRPVIAELAAQATTVTSDGSMAEIDATYRVELNGRPTRTVTLPVTGLVASATVEPAAGAALHRLDGELLLVAEEPGSYTVRVRSRADLEGEGGVSKLKLAISRAPVATLDFDLPAHLDWTCGDVAVVEDLALDGRRRLRLAPARGKRPVLELRRDAAGAVESETRARAVVVTVARLGARGVARHDLVLYDVTRGELNRFAVELPETSAGNLLEVERATTDEGRALPMVKSGRLTVERQRRLSAAGHLELTYKSQTPLRARVPLPELEPLVPVRSRYLVLASDRAGEVEPRPADAWSRVDLEDLPRGPRDQLVALGPNSVWRRTVTPADPWLRAELYETVAALPAIVAQRSTTTLLTVDGSLVHRETFDLRRAGASLEISLSAGVTLWSVKVDDQAVRPIERGATVVVPLGFKAEGQIRVELVAVEERRLGRGASRFGIELARVAVPVLEHRWRLLLPEQHRYRLAGGDLQPAPTHEMERSSGVSLPHEPSEPPATNESTSERISGDAGIVGKVVDADGAALPGVTVTVRGSGGGRRQAITDGQGKFRFVRLASGSYRLVAELEGFASVQRSISVPAGRNAHLEMAMRFAAIVEELVVTSQMPTIHSSRASYSSRSTASIRDETEDRQRRQAARQALASMQGLVGGVKPLAVNIPESGKLLLLAGVLPPPDVGVELEVKAKR